MEYKKLNDGSYVCNCYIGRREDESADALFKQNGDESIAAFLNGYAIIPLEEYAALTGEDYSDMLANAKEADRQLHHNKE